MRWSAQNKNICDKFNLIHVSMSIGHSSALGENGYAVFRGRREAKGCVSAAYAKMPVVLVRRLTQTAPTLLRRFLLSGWRLQSPRSHGV
jgi:hypothetical protein